MRRMAGEFVIGEGRPTPPTVIRPYTALDHPSNNAATAGTVKDGRLRPRTHPVTICQRFMGP
ncbi:MAG TPA: hypothetical protein VLM89_12000 [Phycisphaerae bacterium]|nr:hypothetical protein [Phycisphaerae bacterium]